jgi:hypothetical protein
MAAHLAEKEEVRRKLELELRRKQEHLEYVRQCQSIPERARLTTIQCLSLPKRRLT